MTIIEDFITEDEQQKLKNWAFSRKFPKLGQRNDSTQISDSPHGIWIYKREFPPRFKERCSIAPPIYYDIQSRVTERFGWSTPAEDRQGKSFIHYPGSETPEHLDERNTSRITVMVQNADNGGRLVHNGTIIEIPNRGIVSFDATKPHSVNTVISGTRIVFVFELSNNLI